MLSFITDPLIAAGIISVSLILLGLADEWLTQAENRKK